MTSPQRQEPSAHAPANPLHPSRVLPAGSALDQARVVFANEHAASERVQDAIIEAMDRHAFGKASRFAVRLALAEGIANAFKHGHKHLPPTATITMEFSVSSSRVVVTIEDQGPGFKVEDVPDPTLDENVERTSGRGIMLIRAYMTSITHNAKGNRVEMVYTKPA